MYIFLILLLHLDVFHYGFGVRLVF